MSLCQYKTDAIICKTKKTIYFKYTRCRSSQKGFPIRFLTKAFPLVFRFVPTNARQRTFAFIIFSSFFHGAVQMSQKILFITFF